MRYLILICLFSLFSCQKSPENKSLQHEKKRPKLLVGIVVDQMRSDYIYRYWDYYGDDGFKRLLNEGYQFHNAFFPYIPTYTGPGHASVYSGTSPMHHGIVANNWYQRNLGRTVYCTEDTSVRSIGSESKAGQMSPANMLTTTFCDEWRLFTQKRSKTIGIALKDRGAILPAGHTANAAYWFEGESGNWISSSFYMQQLPEWVQDFNAEKRAKNYMQQNWETLLPIEAYARIATDDVNPYEGPFIGQSKAAFPHVLPLLYQKLGNNLIKNTPFGNSLTFDMARAAIRGEKLGKNEVTDILAVSFSSPDYIGHQFGPRSIEIADQYLRFDRELGDFLRFLDHEIGRDQYVVFLTADHGAADNPLFLKDQRIPSAIFGNELLSNLKKELHHKYGDSTLIANFSNLQFYLDEKKLKSKKLSKREVASFIREIAQDFEGVLFAHLQHDFLQNEYTEGLRALQMRGIMASRSGDVILTLHPAYLEMPWQNTGTTHGSGYSYDTHVPLLFFGKNIPHGESFEKVHTTDIAPTMSNLLLFPYPNGTTGKSLLQEMR